MLRKSIFVAGIWAITVLVVWLHHRKQSTMTRLCAERLAALGGERLAFEVSGSARRVAGVMKGLAFAAVMVSTRRAGARTWIDVAFEPSDLWLSLRRRASPGDREEAPGLALGDPSLNAGWIARGEPGERVTSLLADARLREQLESLRTFEGASITVGDGKVMIAHEGWSIRGGLFEERFGTDFIELALALAAAASAESTRRRGRTEGVARHAGGLRHFGARIT